MLLGLGVPVAYSLGLSTAAALLLSVPANPALGTVAQRMATGLDSFTLLAIPFFILAGQIMNKGGIARRLIALARGLLGTLPGGLAHVNILASMLFGAISGSAAAAASAIGGVMTPSMDEEGYDRPFSAAVNITSSTTGLIIPPSNVLIVYSLASRRGEHRGPVPGRLRARHPGGPAADGDGGRDGVAARLPHVGADAVRGCSIRQFASALPSLFLLVVVMGGIIGGVFTATEAAAVAVLYALVLAFLYREISVRDLPQILLDSAATTAVVMLLIATSIGLSWVLSYESVPQMATEAIIGLTDNKILILLLINAVLLVVGTFMDMTPGHPDLHAAVPADRRRAGDRPDPVRHHHGLEPVHRAVYAAGRGRPVHRCGRGRDDDCESDPPAPALFRGDDRSVAARELRAGVEPVAATACLAIDLPALPTGGARRQWHGAAVDVAGAAAAQYRRCMQRRYADALARRTHL